MTAICNNSVRDSVAEEEWKTRIDLAAFYRLVALHGMTVSFSATFRRVYRERRINFCSTPTLSLIHI